MEGLELAPRGSEPWLQHLRCCTCTKGQGQDFRGWRFNGTLKFCYDFGKRVLLRSLAQSTREREKQVLSLNKCLRLKTELFGATIGERTMWKTR